MSETTVAILLASALEVVAIVAAAGLAYWGVTRQMRERRRLGKQTNSINVMLAAWEDRDLLRAFRIVAKIHDDPRDHVELYAYRDIPEGEDKSVWGGKSQALFALVNYFETISVGVCEDIYDKRIIRKCGETMFTTSHARTRKFIQEVRVRHGAPHFGEYFERVAKEFSSSPQ